jgi:hypothetical protein
LEASVYSVLQWLEDNNVFRGGAHFCCRWKKKYQKAVTFFFSFLLYPFSPSLLHAFIIPRPKDWAESLIYDVSIVFTYTQIIFYFFLPVISHYSLPALSLAPFCLVYFFPSFLSPYFIFSFLPL